MIKSFGCEKNNNKFSEVSDVSSHAAVRSVSGMSPHFAICMAKIPNICVGGIFIHVLVFQENVCAYYFWKTWYGSC